MRRLARAAAVVAIVVGALGLAVGGLLAMFSEGPDA